MKLSGNYPTPKKAFFRVFATVFLLFFTITLLITSLLPTTYSSVARVVVSENVGIDPKAGRKHFNRRAEFDFIQSPPVLEKAVNALDLQNRWGKRYRNGQSLSLLDATDMLRNCISLRPVNHTALIEIQAYSADKEEAADIANALAEAYQAVRDGQQLPLVDPAKLAAAPSGAAMVGRVEIIDRAKPRPIPVRPNKVANLFLAFTGGGFFATCLGLTAALVIRYIRRRNQPPILKKVF